MLNVGTSGLHLRFDRLGVKLKDSFEVVLSQDEVSDEVSGKENILLCGIGVQRQRDGLARQQAMQALADLAGRMRVAFTHLAQGGRPMPLD